MRWWVWWWRRRRLRRLKTLSPQTSPGQGITSHSRNVQANLWIVVMPALCGDEEIYLSRRPCGSEVTQWC